MKEQEEQGEEKMGVQVHVCMCSFESSYIIEKEILENITEKKR